MKQGTDCLNGVNVGDIIRMQNHIIGKTQLDEPNKLLAGDVNHDLKLSILDIIMIRSLILGKMTYLSITAHGLLLMLTFLSIL